MTFLGWRHAGWEDQSGHEEIITRGWKDSLEAGIGCGHVQYLSDTSNCAVLWWFLNATVETSHAFIEQIYQTNTKGLCREQNENVNLDLRWVVINGARGSL